MNSERVSCESNLEESKYVQSNPSEEYQDKSRDLSDSDNKYEDT